MADVRSVDLQEMARRTYASDGVVSTVLGVMTVTGLVVAGLAAVYFSNIEWATKKKFANPDIVTLAPEIEDGEEGSSGPGMDSTSGGEKTFVGDNPTDFIDAPAVDAETVADKSQAGDPTEMLADSLIAEAQATTDIAGPVRTSGTGGPGSGEGSGGSGESGFGQGSGIIPRHQRWTIAFSEQGQDLYAKQLDFFNIELGVVVGTTITYVTDLAERTPKTRVNPNGLTEKRIYFVWREEERKRADARLLAKAGISTGGAIVVHYYQNDLVAKLEALEKAFANREKKKIRNTRFGIRPVGRAEFEFFVESQTPK